MGPPTRFEESWRSRDDPSIRVCEEGNSVQDVVAKPTAIENAQNDDDAWEGRDEEPIARCVSRRKLLKSLNPCLQRPKLDGNIIRDFVSRQGNTGSQRCAG